MVADLRDRTSSTTDRVLAEALALLRAKLDRASRQRRSRGGADMEPESAKPLADQKRLPGKAQHRSPGQPRSVNPSPGDASATSSGRRPGDPDALASATLSGQMTLFPEMARPDPSGSRKRRRSGKSSDGG